MKANEVPEKVFIRPTSFRVPWPPYIDENSNYGGIEYTRTDAFIEKACEFLSNEANIPLWEGCDNTFGCDTTKLISNFKNYMKGE